MKTKVLTLIAGSLLTLTPSLLGDSLTELQGKWTLKKTSDRWGGEVTQTLQVKQDRFTFVVKSKDGQTVLHADGRLQAERLGGFRVLKATDIVGGYSEYQKETTNDDREIIYATGWRTLTLAMNFDRDRQEEGPEADTYTKVQE